METAWAPVKHYETDIKGIVAPPPEDIVVRRGSERLATYTEWLATLTPDQRAFAAMPASRLSDH